MLIFSKLKSNLWPKHDKVVRLIEMIQDEKSKGGNIQKFSLEYRLQNDHDEDFIDTYKAAIVKELAPIRPSSNPHGYNHSAAY